MLLDWFTISAQIVNFLILVVLLKHFLYNRVINAMDERTRKIQSRFGEAEELENENRLKAKEYLEKMDDLEKKGAQIIQQAETEAENIKKRLIEEARINQDELQKAWQKSIEKDRKRFMDDLQQMAVRQVMAVSRHLIENLSGDDLESRMVDMFEKKVKELDENEKKRLGFLEDLPRLNALVATAFPLSHPLKEKIDRIITDEISADLEVKYETRPHLIAGIRVKIGNRKLSWNMKDAFYDLEENLNRLFDSQTSGQDVTETSISETGANEHD